MIAATVVVPSYRGAARLPNLLRSLVAQTFTEFEVVVVVDGDVDGSSRVIRQFQDLDIKPVVFATNRGRAAALNAGFEQARGRVLIRCDDDLRPAPDFVARHVRRHQGPPTGLIGLYRNEFRGSRFGEVYGRDAERRLHNHALSAPASDRWRFWAGNCSVTRDTFEVIGPYDERFDRYGWEDCDWGYRLKRAGIPIAVDPGLTTHHDVPANSTHVRAGRAFHSGSSERIFEEKHDLKLPARNRSSLWDRSVGAASDRLNEARVKAVARSVDRLLPLIPTPVARKVVAFTVECAHDAGYRVTTPLIDKW